MAQPSTYLHLTENLLIGYLGSTITTQVALTQNEASTSILAIQTQNGVGYEFAPEPASGGKLSYRYNPNSTNTIVSFDYNTSTLEALGTANITTQRLFVKPLGGLSVVEIAPQTSGDAQIAINSLGGNLRISEYVDSTSQQGFIQFYKNDNPLISTGTLIGASSIVVQDIYASTIREVNSYTTGTANINTAVVSSFAAKVAIISSLTYTTIVGPTILQVQTIVF